MTGARGELSDLEKRMWELVAEGVLFWTGEPARLPEPVAVNRGPELLSDLVIGCRICGMDIYCRKSVIAEKQTRG